jgi:hypothetical protein
MPPAIVTGYTADKMDEILAETIKAAGIDVNGHLIVTTYDGSTGDLGKVTGAKGDTGGTGPPGTSGVWYADLTHTTQGLDTTYNTLATIVVPTAGYARKVVLWSQTALLAAGTQETTYRAAIRDNTSGTPDTVSHLPWRCPVAGTAGSISLVTEPLDIPANQTKTFIHTARRDASGSGGTTDNDAGSSKFLAFVTAA